MKCKETAIPSFIKKKCCLTYAKERGFTNSRFFVDDGITGTVFNRPGLNAMLEEVKAGRVATVIIKDQSRIGRDVLEVGLMKRTFEENDVRFIAANDNLDTANGFDIMSIFRDVLNEWYECVKIELTFFQPPLRLTWLQFYPFPSCHASYLPFQRFSMSYRKQGFLLSTDSDSGASDMA